MTTGDRFHTDSLPARLGEFELLSVLGRGGHGTVYLARSEALGEVALKVLIPELGGNPLRAQRFAREVELISKLEHPHLVRVLSFGQEGNTPYYAMEVVQGRNIRENLSRSEAVDARWWSTLGNHGRQLLEALDYVHRHEVVHRDLKPENVLIDEQGGVKLVDFGLARSLEDTSDLTRSGTVVGTVNYLSPEQINGTDVDQRSDIFAVGILLLELASGRHPFAGPHTMATMKNILVEDAPIPSDLNAKLAACLRKCLAKEPAQRYSSCADVLHDWCEGLQLPARAGRAPRAPLKKPLEPGILGRTSERLKLHRLLQALAKGKPGCFHVEGVAGMGKSTLTQDLLTEMKARDILALIGVCRDTGHLPCQPLRDAIKPELKEHPIPENLRNGLAPLFPELAGPTREEGTPFTKWGLFEALYRWLESLRRPVALLLDDLHWADPETLQALEFLAGRAADDKLPLLILTSGRPGGPTLPFGETLRLEPLSRQSVCHLVEAMLGAPAEEEVIDYIYAHGHGHPLSVCQLVRSLLEEGSLERAGSEWTLHLSREQRPSGILAVVRHRLQSLHPDWLDLLYAAAVLGKTFPFKALRGMVGESDDRIMEMLENLCERAILLAGSSGRNGSSSSEGRFGFSHDTFREAILETLPATRLKELHAQAGQSLEKLGAPATEIAEHYQAAGWRGQARELYLKAGGEARRALAFERSVELYTLAMESQDNPSKELLESLADALRCAGRPKEAVRLYHTLQSDTEGEERARLLGRVAECHMQAGDNEASYLSVVEALRCCGYQLPPNKAGKLKVLARSAAGMAPAGPDPRRLAHGLYATLAQFHYWTNPDDWKLESLLLHQQIKQAELHHIGRLGFFSHGLDAILRILAPVPLQESALKHARMALEAEPQEPETPRKALAMSHLGQIFQDLGIEAEAREYMHRALAMAERFAAVDVLVDVSLGLSRFFEFQGDLEQAERHGRRALDFRTSFAVTRDVMKLQLARVLILRDRIPEGEALLENLSFLDLPRVGQLYDYTLGWRDVRQKNFEAALARCKASREKARQLPPGPVFHHGTSFQEVEALMGLARYDDALRKARQLVKTADRPAFVGSARRLEGECLHAMGRHQEGEAALQAALTVLRGCDRPRETRLLEARLRVQT